MPENEIAVRISIAPSLLCEKVHPAAKKIGFASSIPSASVDPVFFSAVTASSEDGEMEQDIAG